MEKDFAAYFRVTAPGTVINWAGGTLTMGEKGIATFHSPGGTIRKMSAKSSIADLYQKDVYIRACWDESYGKGVPLKVCPWAYQRPVILGDQVENSPGLGDVFDTEYVDSSPCEYRAMRRSHFLVLNLIVHELTLQFPDRKAPRLTLLDAGSLDGSCPHHTTHNGFPPTALDVQYFTLGESNCTQGGKPRVEIWDEGSSWPGQLNSLFDAKRNAAYILLLAEAFPWLTSTNAGGRYMNNHILMCSKIRAAIMNAAKTQAEREILKKATQDEDTPYYNHHLHMHLYFGEEINPEMIV